MTTGSSRHPVRRPVQALRHSPSEERRMHGRNLDLKPYKIAILWRGDAEARQAATPQNNRFYRSSRSLARSASMPSRRSMTRSSPTRCASSCWRLMECSYGSIRSIKARPGPHSIRFCATSPREAPGSARTPT